MEPGATVYISTGETCEFVGTLPGGEEKTRYVVRRFLNVAIGDDDYYEEVEGRSDPLIVDRVYEQPPIGVFDEAITQKRATIADLDERIFGLRDVLGGLREERRRLTSDLPRLKKKLSDQWHCFSQVDDIIEGRITHVLEIPNYVEPRIVEFEKSSLSDNWEVRMLSVMGVRHSSRQGYTRISWHRNRYRDDSGDWVKVSLYKSREEARQGLSEYIDEMVGDPKVNAYTLVRVMKAADTHGLPFPDTRRDEIVAYLEEEKARKIAVIKERIRKETDALQKLEGAGDADD